MDEDSDVGDQDGYAAAELEDGLVFKTMLQSPMTNKTRSKSQKVFITDTLMSSDSEDKLPCLQPHKHMHASPAPPSAGGHAKYFLLNQNQFLSNTGKKLTACKGSAGCH